jgi:tetratricopeptide (TPR) repeat protein
MRRINQIFYSLFRNLLPAVLFLLIFTENITAKNPQEIFAEANKAYQANNFNRALNLFESLLNEGYESVELYYNIGNTYYRTGNLGHAILNYERALKLSPGDEDIEHNLAFLNSKIVDKIETMPRFFLFEWWEDILTFFSFNGWTIAAFIFYLLALTSLGGYFLLSDISKQKYSFFSALVFSALLLCCISIMIVKYNRDYIIKNGIVTETVVTAKMSPAYDGGDAFVIHEGLKVKIEDSFDDWVKIRLPDGKVGWMMNQNLAII